MITLYHCVDARSFRALWALEEVGVPYELKMLPFPPRYFAREYLEVNPLGTIPLLIDGETRMTESAAICQYLAERYAGPPLSVRPDEPGYGAYLNALHMGEATLTFPQTLVLRYSALEPPERRLPQAVEDYARWTLGRLAGFESLMAGADYAAAGRFTVADISVGYALMMLKFIGLFEQAPGSLRAYYERARARPAFRRAKSAQMAAAAEQGVAQPPVKGAGATA
ncbi:glutathione S-transferase family protein [Roseiarcus sp.]|uniref:glutathione S-transferase family protein n=1 Tax=Roseiarcus sp. TaxID=1969460 RepID=UPI003F95DC37